MPPEEFGRDDVEHALDALASEVPTPTADAASLIARGRRRVMRQRLVVAGIAVAIVAVAAGVGAVANHHDARRVVAPVPTTSTTITKSATGLADQIAAVSSLEAWKCINPLQYTDNGGRSWAAVDLPNGIPPGAFSCTAIAGDNAWATWPSADPTEWHILRIRGGHRPEVFTFPRLPAGDSLSQLTFVDQDHGWVRRFHSGVAPDGLYRTTDGGATWTLASNTRLGSLAFADAARGWSNDGPTLLSTTDGGVSWRIVGIPKPDTAIGDTPGARPNLFRVVARGNGIVVWGGVPISGVRYRPFFDFSTDGGRTWDLRSGPKGFELPGAGNNAFDATDGSHWALTSGRALRTTVDGGQTWFTRPDLPDLTDVLNISFPTANVGWINSTIGSILRTTDGGQTWTIVTDGAETVGPSTTTTTAPTTASPATPAPLTFSSATEGWICSRPLAYTTDDFDQVGAGTKSVDMPASHVATDGRVSQPTLCTSAPGGNAWMLRDSGDAGQPEIVRIRVRSDGTDTSVTPFARIPQSTVESISFADASHGWALVHHEGGSRPDLWSTGDGGASWSLLLRDAPIAPPLDFTSTTRGWASASEAGSLKTTTDSGITWHGVNVPTKKFGDLYTNIRPVLVHGNVVVAYGQAGTGNFFVPFFDVSTDGGQSWSIRSGPKNVELPGTAPSDFSAADADHWVIGTANLLYVTDDGGRTWTQPEQFSGLDSIWYVARPSATAMFASGIGDPSGTSTVVLGTTDGGDHWRTVDEQAPAGPPGSVASFPGGIIGCPTRRLTPEPPSTAIAQAARDYVQFPGPFVSAVYRADSTEGDFAKIFSFNVGSCRPNILDSVWVAYVQGVPNAGPGGSTARVTLALAHYADGWHVFGRYP